VHETPVTLTVSAESRPLRVAYLVDPDHDDPGVLDAILYSLMDRWGGRRRGIFPLVAGDVPEPWWVVIEALDPDLVLSTRKLSAQLVDKITRRILPYEIREIEVDKPRDEGDLWRISTTDRGVDILGVPPAVAKQKGTGANPGLVYMYEGDKTSPDRRFILRNFGLLPATVGVQASFEHLPHLAMDCGEMTAVDVLKELTSVRYDIVTPIQLSALEAPGPWIPFTDRHAHAGFYLVVGATMRDAILAWNRALCVDPTQNDRTLWAPLSLFSDSNYFDAIVQWLHRTNRSRNEHDVVVSYEHSIGELEILAGRLRTALGRHFSTRVLAENEYLFPTIVHQPWRASGMRGAGARTTLEHVPFAKGRGTIAVAPPPSSGSPFPQGEWMVDVLIPHRPELHLHQTNSEPPWTLPKRLGIGPGFFEIHEARVTAVGLPSAKVDAGCRRLELRIPSDHRLFWECLAPGQSVYGPADPFRERLLTDFAPSTAGRAVRGIIDVFGSLWACGRTLSDPFWRATFALLSGQRTVVHSDRRALLLEALQDYLQHSGIALTSVSPELSEVAEMLAKTLLETEPRRPWITIQELTQNFSRLRSERLVAPSATDDGNFWEVRTSFDDDQKRKLEELVDVGVFAIGCTLTCSRCGSTNWFAIELLRTTMVCPGCANEFGVPLEPRWSYRLNSLVENAFRTSGGLASLQVLYNAESLCPYEPFVFLPPQDFALSGGGTREADILCFWNGYFVIGEVKSQSRAFRDDDFERMRLLARELKPDKIWFAAPQRDWPSETISAIRAFAAELEPLGVAVEVFHLGWWHMSPPTRL